MHENGNEEQQPTDNVVLAISSSVSSDGQTEGNSSLLPLLLLIPLLLLHAKIFLFSLWSFQKES